MGRTRPGKVLGSYRRDASSNGLTCFAPATAQEGGTYGPAPRSTASGCGTSISQVGPKIGKPAAFDLRTRLVQPPIIHPPKLAAKLEVLEHHIAFAFLQEVFGQAQVRAGSVHLGRPRTFACIKQTALGLIHVALAQRDSPQNEIAVFTGSAISFANAWFAVPWLGASSTGELLATGTLRLGLKLALEVGFGRPVLRASWQRVAADFDFRKGGLLSIGKIVLRVAPLLVGKLRGLV